MAMIVFEYPIKNSQQVYFLNENGRNYVEQLLNIKIAFDVFHKGRVYTLLSSTNPTILNCATPGS